MEENDNVKGTILSDEQLADWGNEQTLIEPGQEDKSAAAAAEAGTDPAAGTDAAADDNADDQETAESSDETQVEYVADPGDFVPNDYSFEVTSYDDDNKPIKTHKIDSIDEWDKLVESNPNFGSPAALLKAQRMATKMENNIENDRKDWQKRKDEYDNVVNEDRTRTEQLSTWQSEMDYLVQRGDLPKLPDNAQNLNWSDSEVAKQEGIREQVALIKFMEKENNLRVRAGLKPMTSLLDAFNAYRVANPAQPKAADTKKAEASARKAAGARVAGGSANPVSAAPKGIAVGRGGSLEDLSAGWGW